MTKNNRAFTLIELLVVVLIIGILAAVALPQYQKAVGRAYIIQIIPFMNTLYHAQQRYLLENGQYTFNFSELDVSVSCPDGWTCSIGQNAVGQDQGRPKFEARHAKTQTAVVMYYGDALVCNVQVKGKVFCSAETSNQQATNICKSFGPLFGTCGGYSRYFIQ